MMNYKDGIKALFENLRNLTVCALLIAAGLYENKNSSGIFGWLQIDVALGWGLVAIGVLLSLARQSTGGCISVGEARLPENFHGYRVLPLRHRFGTNGCGLDGL